MPSLENGRRQNSPVKVGEAVGKAIGTVQAVFQRGTQLLERGILKSGAHPLATKTGDGIPRYGPKKDIPNRILGNIRIPRGYESFAEGLRQKHPDWTNEEIYWEIQRVMWKAAAADDLGDD